MRATDGCPPLPVASYPAPDPFPRLRLNPVESEEKLVVAAVADLTPTIRELGTKFEQATGTKITFNFSSIGILARQIENGAPIDLFAAANIGFVDGLEKVAPRKNAWFYPEAPSKPWKRHQLRV